MEEYDPEFLTFTIKDEPEDSEDDFIGFEDNSSSYVDMYKQYILVDSIKDEFQQMTTKPLQAPKQTIRKVPQPKVTKRPAVVKRIPKPAVANIKVELPKDDPLEIGQQEENLKSGGNKTRTDIEITVMGSLTDSGIKTSVYICDICGAKYTRKSKLRTHILNHVVRGPNELPLCEYCGEVFDSVDSFFSHFENVHHANHDDVLITFDQVKHVLCCEYCGNAYAHPESLNKHRVVHAGKPKPYQCQFCDTHFDQYSKLVTHALKHNDIKTDFPVDRYWLCDYEGCTKSLKNITSLNYHKKNVHQKKYMSQCKECGQVFENSWSLHNHMQVKHLGPFPCIICDRNCPTTKLLKRHMLTHTKVESDQPNQSRRFVNYCKYLQIDPNGTFTCKECKQNFDTRKRFRTHVVESHDKSKNFFCPQCDKGFTLAWQLNSHVENTHVKKFQCTICGVFKNKQSKLQQHMKIHQFPCHCCDKSFSRQIYLESHIKKRHISKLICGNFEQKVLNKCEYVDSNGVRRPQPTKIYVMPGPCPEGSIASQTPIRTINVNISQEQCFVEPKIRRRQDTSGASEQYSYENVNDQHNLENLAAIAFLESEMSQAAKLLTMPFINK
ncbi:hypothetical protein HA402_016145 [Bradysia odoriphaga]|nr:hypothetical protein HA402_016145 [Bradysia odoriphaga]